MILLLAATPRYVGADGTERPLSGRDAALLAWLAVEGPTPRRKLASLLWPDSSPEAARNTLRQRLFQLRRQTGASIVAGDETLALAAGVHHDLHDAHTVLGDAEHDYSDDYLGWLRQERMKRSALRVRRLEEAIADREGAGDFATALQYANDLLLTERTSERAHLRVMRLHYLAGDRAAALAAFEQCEDVLREEFGAAPSAEALALRAAILAATARGLPAPRSVPPTVLHPPRLTGRDEEQAALADAVIHGGAVLLLGEAGLGKSRLIDELRGRYADTVISAGGRAGDVSTPHALSERWLRQLLATRDLSLDDSERAEFSRVVPGLSATFLPSGDRARFFAAVERVLAKAVRSGLRALVIDDAQFADAASIELLTALIGTAGCGWIVAGRPPEAGTPWAELLEAHADSTRAATLHLKPLDPAAVVDLLDGLHIDGVEGEVHAQGLHRRTGGNPLYLLETLKTALVRGLVLPGRSIEWPRADNVVRLIQTRLSRLSPLGLQLARLAALAGQDLSSPLAAAVLQLRPLDLADAWAELEAAQVLSGDRFTHDLVAEAALALVPVAIAEPLHADIAAVLERTGGQPGRIAWHWLRAAQPRRAAPQMLRAAAAARAAWQLRDAVDLYERAGAIFREAGDRRAAFDAYFAACEAASEIGVDERVRSLCEVVEALASDPGQWAAAACIRIALLFEARELDPAHDLLHQALAWAQQAGLPDIEVELRWDLTALHWERRELGEAARAAEHALGQLESVDPATARLPMHGTRLKLTHALGLIQASAGHYAQSDQRLVAALELARQADEHSVAVGILNSLAANAVEQGDLRAADGWCSEAYAACSRGVIPNARALSLSTRATVLAIGGDLGGALDSAQQVLSLCESELVRYSARVRRTAYLLQFELGRRDMAVKGLRALRQLRNLVGGEPVELDAALLHVGDPVDAQGVLDGIVGLPDFALRARLLCLAQPGCSPEVVLPLLTMTAASALDHGAHGLWLGLQAHRLAALRAVGRLDEAGELAHGLWRRLSDGLIGIEPFPRVAAELCGALAETDADLAQVIALRASAWMQRAASTLPLGWRENYLTRAPILQALPPRARGLLLQSNSAGH